MVQIEWWSCTEFQHGQQFLARCIWGDEMVNWNIKHLDEFDFGEDGLWIEIHVLSAREVSIRFENRGYGGLLEEVWNSDKWRVVTWRSRGMGLQHKNSSFRYLPIMSRIMTNLNFTH